MNGETQTMLTSLPHGCRAVIIGSSGGIGAAITALLKGLPNVGEVVEISRSGGAMDLADENSVAACARSMSQPVHLLICATGILTVDGTGPEKSLRQLDPDIMLAHFRTNAIGPALVAKHFLPRLDRQSRTMALFLSARVGSIGDNRLGGWISYRSSKAALNQIVKTASIEMSRTHPKMVVAAVHPGTVATPLSAPYRHRHATVSPEEAARRIVASADQLHKSGVFVAYDGSPIAW